MPVFELTIREQIAAPPERVFAAASDFANAPKAIPGILRVEMLTPGPVRAGTRFRETRRMFGKEASEEMTVAELEPPRRYLLTAESHGSRYRTEFRFEPGAAAGTEVVMTFRGEPLTTFAKVMTFVMKPMMKSMAKLCARDLADLKRSIEGGGGDQGVRPAG
jgi:carbon monoxide dehydrogenase subunit G